MYSDLHLTSLTENSFTFVGMAFLKIYLPDYRNKYEQKADLHHLPVSAVLEIYDDHWI